MATTFFFRDDNSDIDPTTDVDLLFALTRGAGSVALALNTVAGPTAPIQFGNTLKRWFSNPLDAVTISGNITVNIRALENNAMANVCVKLSVDRCSNSGSVISNLVNQATPNASAELGTVEAAQTGTVTPTSTTLSAGDRLQVILYADDSAAATMASGFSCQVNYAGPTGGASGDSFLTFTETITEQSGGAAATIPDLGMGLTVT